jgi:ABC-type multidrug transport system ATPase subunit
MSKSIQQKDNPEIVIRTNNLTKEYNGRTVVSNINLAIRRGEIYGFLGPNGAGKTTTIRMILGLLPPSSGTIEIFGQDLQSSNVKIRQRLGVVGEHSYLYDDMTAIEYLMFFARLYGVENARRRSRDLLEWLDLAPFSHLLAREFSQGMQKKLMLARALLHDPEVLILDEPVSGLDPYGIVQVRELLEKKRQEGQAIIISSHILSEVERTADRIGIIHRGRLVTENTIEAVISDQATEMELDVELQIPIPGLIDILKQLPNVLGVQAQGVQLTITVEGLKDLRPIISQVITEGGGIVVGMQSHRASLEQAFIRLTEGKLEQLGLVESQE